MARFRGTVISPLAPTEAFDYLADFANAAAWDPGTASAERLDDGPVGEGSRFLLQVRVGSRTTPLEYRITAYDRPHRVVLLGESASVRSEDTVTVAPTADGGSAVTYDADLRLLGPSAVGSPFLGPAFRRIGGRGLDGLRRALGGPGAPASPPTAPGVVGSLVDELLEATVVGSFSSVGPRLRSRLAGWADPPRLDGRVVLVTGATSGIGRSTAEGVARLGAAVRLVARDPDRGEAAAEAVRAAAPGADVDVLLADLADLDQVRDLAGRFLATHDRLDVLVHNAGALSRTYTTAPDGTEVTVAAQLVGPFLLTGLLLPALRAAAPSRVVQVSSGGLYTQRFDLAALSAGPEGYDGTVTYARVKRAQLVLMHEWVRRLSGTAVSYHAMHPGWADTPGIRTGLPGFARVMGPLLRTADEGAATAVWLAAAPEGVETTGGFWLDRRERWEHKLPWTRLSPDADADAGAALWAWCAARAGWDLPGR